MGIVPLQYKAGDTAESLGLTGKEKFDIHLPATLVPGQDIAVNTDSGKSFNVTSRYGINQGMKVIKTTSDKYALSKVLVKKRHFKHLFRFDTDLELIYYAHGGILNYMVRKLVKQSTS